MADSIYKWSMTASSNDAADSIVNWRENQLPDTLNDSARAMMKRVAEWREDLTGNLVTSGTQPSYIVSTNAAFDTLANGRSFTARIHATNTGTPATMNANGLGALQIRKFGVTGDLPVAPGDLQLGNLYTFNYSAQANGGAGGWIIGNPSIATGGGFASGTALVFAMPTSPTGWTKSAANNDKVLRVVSGGTGGSAGGNTAFSTVFTSARTASGSGSVDPTALTTAQIPAHAHTQQGSFTSGFVSSDHSHAQAGTWQSGGENVDHVHSCNMYGGDGGRFDGFGGNGTTNFVGPLNSNGRNQGHVHSTSIGGSTGGISANHQHAVTISGSTANSGSGASHTHGFSFTSTAMDFDVQYVDTIICTKD